MINLWHHVWTWGAMDCRWPPQFGTYTNHRSTGKFNHHRVKVYCLHVFCVANLLIQTILNHSSKREHTLGFLPLPHTSETSTITQTDSSFTLTYTQSYIKIRIWQVNTVEVSEVNRNSWERKRMRVSILGLKETAAYKHLLLSAIFNLCFEEHYCAIYQ